MKVEWHRKDAVLNFVEDDLHLVVKFGVVKSRVGEISHLSKAVEKGWGHPRQSGELACEGHKLPSLEAIDDSGAKIKVGKRKGDKNIR